VLGAEQVGGTVRLKLSVSKPLLLSSLLRATDTLTGSLGWAGWAKMLSYMKTLS